LLRPAVAHLADQRAGERPHVPGHALLLALEAVAPAGDPAPDLLEHGGDRTAQLGDEPRRRSARALRRRRERHRRAGPDEAVVAAEPVGEEVVMRREAPEVLLVAGPRPRVGIVALELVRGRALDE